MTLATVLFKKKAEEATPVAAPAPATPAPKPPGFMDRLGDVASKGFEASKDIGNKHLWGDAKGSPYDGKSSLPAEYLKGLQTGHVGTLAGTAGGIGAAALLGHLLFSNKKRRQA